MGANDGVGPLPLAVTAVLLAAGLAGCIGTQDGDSPVQPAGGGPVEDGPLLEMEMPIQVVPVGFEDVDRDRLLAHLDQPDPSYIMSRAFATGGVDPEPIQYNVSYEVRKAPDAFAEALFAFVDDQAEPARPTSFLESYDREGHHRICPEDTSDSPSPLDEETPCEDVRHVPAQDLEAWIAEHRAAYGLDGPEPGYTVFVLDHHSKAYLPRDTYHQYTIEQAHPGSDEPLRAWGGNHDFVFLDASAGPNAYDDQPWALDSRPNASLTDRRDLPVWDYEEGEDAFYENLARNVADATNALWARSPNRALDHAGRYVVPYYIFIDPNTRPNPDHPLHAVDPLDVPAHTDEEGIQAAFEMLLPWAKVETEFHYVYLPEDDPAMHRVLEDAKTRHPTGEGAGPTDLERDVDLGVVRKHLKDNWDDYVPDPSDARVHPMFLFWVQGPQGVGTSGYADEDAWGDPWAAFSTIGDVDVCPGRTPPTCTPEDRPGRTAEEAWRVWNGHLTHEVGHSLGLNHPFQPYRFAPDGQPSVDDNTLWDSVATTMSYRTADTTFNAFDRDFLLRHHTAHVAAEVLRDGEAPQPAREKAWRALSLIEEGRAETALEVARQARAATGEGGVLKPPSVGPTVRGETVSWTFTLPAGDQNHLRHVPWEDVPEASRPTVERFPVDIPEDALAVEVAYEEADRPAHPLWGVDVRVVDDGGQTVVALENNAWDETVLRDLDRCAGSCTGILHAWGGVATTYEVSVTPILSQKAAL